jgi:hypothetical protein
MHGIVAWPHRAFAACIDGAKGAWVDDDAEVLPGMSSKRGAIEADECDSR